MLFRDKITQIFYDFDEYLKNSHPDSDKEFSLTNQPKMSLSEMASIEIGYHQSKYKCFKFYYQQEILINLKSYFPNAVSYERFVILKNRLQPYVESFMRDTRLSKPTDANYIDASKSEVCHLMRVPSHKIFKGKAKYGRTIMGRFFGFKFHMIINHLGLLVDIFISTGNVADNNKDLLRKITENFWGLLIGDKGYITSINHQLENNGIHLVTKVRKNMTPVKYAHRVEYYKKHRGLVETSIGLLKNKANIQHTRHRSTINFEVNIWAAMIAYSYNDKLPSIKTFKQNIKPLSPIHNQMQISIAA